MSIEPELVPSPETPERNWLPVAVSAAVILIVVVVAVVIMQHGKGPSGVTPISATPDAYAANLPISHLVMSESANLSGGKVTYLDGHIANQGGSTVTSVTVQVLFRDPAHEVTQNETQQLKLIRTREPYVDIEPISSAPLKPSGEGDFRLIFDTVSPNWDGTYPELRVIHVQTK